MNPKAQEYATVAWAVWDLASSAFYVLAPDGTNNKLGFYGKFEVALDYNDGDVAATTDFADQAMYSFPAVVRKLYAQQSAARKVNAHTGGGTAQPRVNFVVTIPNRRHHPHLKIDKSVMSSVYKGSHKKGPAR